MQADQAVATAAATGGTSTVARVPSSTAVMQAAARAAAPEVHKPRIGLPLPLDNKPHATSTAQSIMCLRIRSCKFVPVISVSAEQCLDVTPQHLLTFRFFL